MSNKDFTQKGVSVKVNNFAPVFTPGLGQKELVDDNGLKDSMQYLNRVGVGSSLLILSDLYNHYPAEMINEMKDAILKRFPEATEEDIVLTIRSHLE